MRMIRKLCGTFLAAVVLTGCAKTIPHESDLMSAAGIRGGKLTLVSYDDKTKTVVIARELRNGDILHDGIYREEYRFDGNVWLCMKVGPTH